MVQAIHDSNLTSARAEAAPELEAWRFASRYEAPTAEKILFGKRMRHAREVAGLTLTDAAVAMGYSQPVQLSNMENGNRMVTLRILLHAAALYGTTADFLCGLSPEVDRDPAVSVQALVASRITAEIRTLLTVMSKTSVDVVRKLQPDVARTMRLAGLVLEAATALTKLRGQSPVFDELYASATLVTKLEVAADLARQHVDDLDRARRRMQGCRLMELAIEVAHDTAAEQLQGFDLSRLRPLHPDALVDDGEWLASPPPAAPAPRATA